MKEEGSWDPKKEGRKNERGLKARRKGRGEDKIVNGVFHFPQFTDISKFSQGPDGDNSTMLFTHAS